jgi:hypothetical protein
MNNRTLILAFLAARYPAAYDDAAITQRLNRSGLLDGSVTNEEVREELRVLANRFKTVEPELDKISGSVYWTATEEGVKQWHLDGAVHVG